VEVFQFHNIFPYLHCRVFLNLHCDIISSTDELLFANVYHFSSQYLSFMSHERTKYFVFTTAKEIYSIENEIYGTRNGT